MNRLHFFTRRLLLLVFFIGYAAALSAQDSTHANTSKNLIISTYAEVYYIYDFGNPANHNRPDFLYSFNRHNEVNLNFGFVQAAYENERVRGKLALMAGTYANANLAAEPGVLKNIFEANAGVKLSANKNLWLDAGVFASHLGFEGAIGADCWTMTRSLLAESAPYYLSGAKVTYTTDNGRWLFGGLALNGWQRMQRLPGNQTPAFGHQINFMPNEKITIGSSSFIGSDTPDSARLMRYFHSLYGRFQLTPALGLIAGFDIGMQQQAPGSSRMHTWYAPIAILRLKPVGSEWSVAARAEYYADPSQVIVATGTPNGFQTFGYSLNVDRQLTDNLLWRMEARLFQSRRDAIFTARDSRAVNGNQFIGTSLALSF
ncbi:porin [Rhodoflexus sp.]